MSLRHDHHERHDHAHAPAVTRDNERKVLLAFCLTATFMVVEIVGGVLSGSLALIADAGHMLTDAAALALAYAAFVFGKRAADQRRTFGYLRFEVVAGFVNAITLFAIVGWIIYEAVQRFQNPHAVLAGPMLAVAVAGLLVNIAVLWILTRGDADHVNIKGAALHVLGDLLGSVGAIVAAIAIYYTGWAPIDPLLSVIVALLIVRSAWKLAGESVHILLEGAPPDISPAQIERLLLALPGIAAVGHVHIWQITSGRTLATLHVCPADNAQARAVVRAAAAELKAQLNIEHATIEIDWNDRGEETCCLAEPPGNASAGHGGDDDGHHHQHGGHAH